MDHKTNSNAIKKYGRFLSEPEEHSCWIFQGNPKYYDVVGVVESLDVLTWRVNQYPKQIKAGDRAYIWLSGPDGGIIGSGVILRDPEMREPLAEDPYRRGEIFNNRPYLAVDIRIDRKLTKAIVPRNIL
ncbi:MAG: EVE domain-containing protein, partial [Candidatus Adiutrix sp.]|nr:EVE domain-containing protein [Candidatus Adiutrix sp.]